MRIFLILLAALSTTACTVPPTPVGPYPQCQLSRSIVAEVADNGMSVTLATGVVWPAEKDDVTVLFHMAIAARDTDVGRWEIRTLTGIREEGKVLQLHAPLSLRTETDLSVLQVHEIPPRQTHVVVDEDLQLPRPFQPETGGGGIIMIRADLIQIEAGIAISVSESGLAWGGGANKGNPPTGNGHTGSSGNSSRANGGVGGLHDSVADVGTGAAGGGNRTPGDPRAAGGGLAYPDSDFLRLRFGSGGGGGGADQEGNNGREDWAKGENGGHGGGIMILVADEIRLNGELLANGAPGIPGAAGGGAGGTGGSGGGGAGGTIVLGTPKLVINGDEIESGFLITDPMELLRTGQGSVFQRIDLLFLRLQLQLQFQVSGGVGGINLNDPTKNLTSHGGNGGHGYFIMID